MDFSRSLGSCTGWPEASLLFCTWRTIQKYGATQQVEETTVQNVRRLVIDFVLPHALEFYRASETATDGERLRRIASWILTSGKTRILASDLTTNVATCRGLTLLELQQRVSALVAAGWLLPADNTPGCRAWQVAPLVHQQFAERAKDEDARMGKHRASDRPQRCMNR